MSDPRISGHKCLFWVIKYTIHWKNSHLNRFNEKINLILDYLTPGTLKKWNLVNFLHQKGLYGLKYVGQTYFLKLSKVQNTLFLYLYTSRSGAKRVEICYTKKPFFQNIWKMVSRRDYYHIRHLIQVYECWKWAYLENYFFELWSLAKALCTYPFRFPSCHTALEGDGLSV